MNKKKMNKFAVSLMIAYVMLITIAIILSVFVYSWLKIEARNAEEDLDCEDGTSIILTDYYELDQMAFLQIKNTGVFSIDGVKVTVSDMPDDDPYLQLNNSYGDDFGIHDFSGLKLKPGDSEWITYYNLTQVGNEINIKEIRKVKIQPYYINDRGKTVYCKGGKIIEERVDFSRMTWNNFHLTPGFLSWWKIDDREGVNLLIDRIEKGGRVNISLRGTFWWDLYGIDGRAVNFSILNSQGGESTSNLIADIDGASDGFSVIAWVNPERGLGKYYSRIIQTRPDIDGTDDFDQGFVMSVSQDGDDYIFIPYRNSGFTALPQRLESSTSELRNDTWQMITGSYNCNTQIAKLYVNSRIVDSKSIGGVGTCQDIDKLVYIGADELGGQVFNGSIDEVMIFDRVLSDEEVKRINDLFK